MYPFTAGIVTQTRELWEELRPALDANSIRVLFELPGLPDNWAAFQERIDRVRPDVVIVEVSNLPEPIEDVIQRIRSASSHPAVFALHSTADAQVILSSMRAGASEFLTPPLQETLRAAFQRLEQNRSASGFSAHSRGKTLGFLSVKGGCGATTIACHLAADLGKLTNQKVLLADLDMQAGLVYFLTKSKTPYSVADAAGNLQRLDPSYWRALISNGFPNLEIIPAPSSPAAKEVPAAQLKQVISFARSIYEITVADLGRNLTPTTLSLLEQIDEVYLVTTYDIPALHQAQRITKYLLENRFPENRVRLILNRKPRHMDLTSEEIGTMLRMPVFATLPDGTDELQEAYTQGRLVDAGSNLGRAFMELAGRIGAVEIQKPKRFSFLGL